jgi:hypothetical protein
MKKVMLLGVAAVGILFACSPKSSENAAAVDSLAVAPLDNVLSPEEQAEGWMLLFDGKSMQGWRAFNGDTTPANWIIEEGAMKGLGATGGEDFGGDYE